MPWIIIKHPIIWGYAIDVHQIIPPEAPPIGPPPGTPQPAWPWLMPHHIPVAGEFLSGKFTDGSEVGEGLGICLWQHDWGLLQVHIPASVVPANPWIGVILIGSTLKLQLPSSGSQMKATGGVLAPAGSAVAPAPAFPCGFIFCQSCWDISGWSFVAPTGQHISAPSTVFLDVKVGDIVAGVAAMLGDAARGMAASAVGNAVTAGITSKLVNAIMSNVVSAVVQLGWSAVSAGLQAAGVNTDPTTGIGGAAAWVLTHELTGSTPFDVLANSVQGKGSSVAGPD
jgi:hypothetical protein